MVSQQHKQPDILPLLDVRNVHKRYRKGDQVIDVLAGASFSIHAKQTVSIVGKSGAGKSTLLHLMGTLDKPDQGTVAYAGQELTGLGSAQLARFRSRELGFVFQFHHLLPEFTAVENVMMPPSIRRYPKAQCREMAEKALEEVGLSQRLNHKPGELSGGEQQRVALARALVLDPPLLLADEVTGNLDAKTSEEIHDLLFGLNERRGVTLVLVTHNMPLADRMSQKLVLEDGLVRERE
jgi:lipoprotein-releasing system ATP-binding protein